MPDAQLANKLSARELVQPRCPMCEAHMEVLRIVPGRPGFAANCTGLHYPHHRWMIGKSGPHIRALRPQGGALHAGVA
jgi:hypothetical protein